MTSAVLVGLAVGDALGQPFECRGDAVHPDLAAWDGSYQPGTHHKLPAGHSTDDTEMAVALAQAIVYRNGYVEDEAALRYVDWFKGTPHGMGGTTRKAMQRLVDGEPCCASGVTFDDPEKVGNGTAMRVAPIGVWYRDNAFALQAAAVRDAFITHRSPEAGAGSLAIAWAVKYSLDRYSRLELFEKVLWRLGSDRRTRVAALLYEAQALLVALTQPDEAIARLGRFGNVSQTVASALFCAAWAPDFEQGVCAAIRGGGDTDTRGAITGAILGARFGLEGIPEKYQQGLLSFDVLRNLDETLFAGDGGR